MRFRAIVLVIAVAYPMFLAAQEHSAADAAFIAALRNVRQELRGAPPFSLQNVRDGRDLPTNAIVVARRTIDGAPQGFRKFVETYFGVVIAKDLLQAYGDNGPTPGDIDQSAAGGFSVLPLDDFEAGPFTYDWQRLNLRYPEVRYVVRMSRPVVDSLGTYAVVRYELLGRDRPETLRSPWPWQHASFVKFEKQPDGSWKRTIGTIGALWN